MEMKTKHLIVVAIGILVVGVGVTVYMDGIRKPHVNVQSQPDSKNLVEEESPRTAPVEAFDEYYFSPELVNSSPYARAMTAGEILEIYETQLEIELPKFAEKIRGKWSNDRFAAIAFEIPSDRSDDFQNHLVQIGVPEEAFKRKSLLKIRLTPNKREIEEYRRMGNDVLFFVKSELPSDPKHDLDLGLNLTESPRERFRLLNPKLSDSYCIVDWQRDTGTVLIIESELEGF